MEEVNPLEFYESVTDEDDTIKGEERVLEASDNRALTVIVTDVDRNWLFDQLDRLPDEMKEVLGMADNPEEAEEKAREEGLLSSIDGETLRTFEDICKRGLEHEELTEHHWEAMVKEFDLQVLFPIGAEIMQNTLGEGGAVTDFHEVGSGKSSS